MAILGLHPLDVPRPRVVRAAPTRSAEHAPSPSEPKLRLTPARNGYVARLSLPPDVSVRNLAFSVSDDGSLIIVEGVASATGIEYLVHHTTAVVASPSRSRTLGHAHAGAVLQGSAPVHGWVELAEGQGWLSDRFLEPVRRFAGRPRRFEASAALPDDANVDAAERSSSDGFEYFIPRKQTQHEPAAKRYRVVIASRVAVRTAPTPRAPVAGVVHSGDVVSGTEAAPNWLKIGHAAYIMIKHPEYGPLLQPLEPSVPPRSAARVDQVGESARTEPRTASEAKAAHTSEVRTAKRASASAGGSLATSVGGAVLQTNPVLSACKVDAANVQRPIEQCEWWTACSDGSFSYVQAY